MSSTVRRSGLALALAALPACSFVFDWDQQARARDAATIDAAKGAADGAPCTGAGCGEADAGDLLDAIGCADGEREGFVNVDAQPNIAGCAGGFALPGVRIPVAPVCARQGGDDGSKPEGTGCNASDLCAAGWHICLSPAEVAASSAGGTCADSVPSGAPPLFFVTRQSGAGLASCGEGANDLFGCGTLGIAPGASCSPLDRFSNDLCGALAAPWACGNEDNVEAEKVTKPGAGSGGVLCCRD